jgi:hypothetical protein
MARKPITSATNMKTTPLSPVSFDISLLLASEHTQIHWLSYLYDLQTFFIFSRLDPPIRCLANLLLPMCSSLPLFRRHALDTASGPWIQHGYYKIDVRVFEYASFFLTRSRSEVRSAGVNILRDSSSCASSSQYYVNRQSSSSF